MSGPVSSAVFWVTAGATALGVAWTSLTATSVVRDLLLVVWLILSSVR